MCTGSLPDPAADPNTENPPSKFFSPYIRTGNGQNRNITIASDKKPSVTWIKNYLGDTVSWNIWQHGYSDFDGDPDSFLELQNTALPFANQGNDGPFTAAPSATALPFNLLFFSSSTDTKKLSRSKCAIARSIILTRFLSKCKTIFLEKQAIF